MSGPAEQPAQRRHRPPDADVLVVGGGPVGLAAAVGAALRGADVLVVEPRPGPVDKACGEGLMPGTLRLLDALGVDPPGRAFAGIRYVGADGASAAHDFTAGPGRGVRRTALHEALSRRADEVGVRRLAARVRTLSQAVDAVVVGVDDGTTLRARWVIGCDGLHSRVRSLALLDGRVGPMRRYGQRRHAATAPWGEHVEVHWGRGAEAYVTPVAGDLVGVAVLAPRGTTFEAGLSAVPALRSRLEGAAWVTPVRGAGPLWQRARSVRAGRVLLAGDAAGYVDAATGEGLRVGLASAAAAVDALAGGDAARYEAAWRRASRGYRWLTGGLVLGTAVPPLRRALVPAAARLPAVFGAAVESLAR